MIGVAFALPLIVALGVPSVRQATWRAIAPRANANEPATYLEAVLADRKLHVMMQGGATKTYDVAIGTNRFPTPTGRFTISRIIWNPGWVPPNSSWARGKRARGPGDPENPMKVAKIFFRQPYYYIHGTGHTESLGTAASHGCLRMHPDEVAELGAALMQAGGVSHDWDWVKRTLKIGSTRTINLKTPVRLTILADRPELLPSVDGIVPLDNAQSDTLVIPVGGQGPADTSTTNPAAPH